MANPADKTALPKVTVLLGGTNSEQEISLDSGRRILETLLALGYTATALYYEGHLDDMLTGIKGAEVVFNALHGGDGEDGTVQAALDKAGIPYTGSRTGASRLAMNKNAAKQLMVMAGIPTAEWTAINLPGEAPLATGSIPPEVQAFCNAHPYPLVVKPNDEGSTVGVTIVSTAAELDMALSVAREFSQLVLMEDYVPGRELTVTIFDGRPLPVVEILPKYNFYDYESKYRDGMSEYRVPAELPQTTAAAMQGAAQLLYDRLDCRHYARVDFRMNPEEKFYCLELNTLPGMTAHSLTPMAARAAGLEFPALIDRIVRMAWADRQKA